MSQYPSRRTPGRRIRLSTLAAALGAALALVWLIASVKAGFAARAALLTPEVALLSDVQSHSHLYRASMIPSSESIEQNRRLTWTIEVRTAAGAPVERAALALESWMPDDAAVTAPRPRANELGDGRYSVQGLRFDRHGWWNVKLRISAAAGTDSLAFNLVLAR